MKITGFLILILTTFSTLAGEMKLLTYSGRILKPDSTPVEASSVNFTIKILSPEPGRCLLWEEQQTVNMTDSDGVFSVEIGKSANRTSGLTQLSFAFQNSGTFSSLTCASGTSFAPAANDDRLMVVSFNDGSGTQSLSEMKIKSVPHAMYADKAGEAMKVSGVEVSTATPSNGQALIYNSATSKWEPQSLGGGGTITGVTAGTGLSGGGTSGTVTLNVNTGTAAGQIPVLDGSAKIPIALIPNIPVDQISSGAGKYFTYQPNNTACATNEFLKWDGAKWICGTAGAGSVTSVTATTPLSSTGGATPDISFSSQTANAVLAAPNGSAGVPSFRALVSADIPNLPASKIASGLTANRIMIGNGSGTAITADGCASGEVMRYNGTSWQCEGGNAANQHVKLDGTGKLPTLDGSALTNLPAQLPSQTGNSGKFLTTNGSSASWGTVTGADNLGNHTATQNLDLSTYKLVGNGSSAGISIDSSGNVSTGNSLRLQGATSGYSGIQSPAIGSNVTWTLPSGDGSSGQVLQTNGSGQLSWINPSSSVTAAIAPSFSVNKNSVSQSIPNAVQTKVTWSTKAFDTNNNFDTTNSKYLPTVAGKYLLNISTHVSMASGNFFQIHLYKNGSDYLNKYCHNSSAADFTCELNGVVDANGVSDYFEVYVYHGAGSSISLYGYPQTVYFSGALLAPLASGSVAGTGTANYVPMWSNSTNITNSPLAVSSTNVGIGTASPNSKLEVAGVIHSTSGGIKFPDGTTQTTASGGGSGVTWQLIASYDFSSTGTSYTFSGLNGDADEEYKVLTRIVSSSSASINYGIQINGDTTSANYGDVYTLGYSGGSQGGLTTTRGFLYTGVTSAVGQVNQSESLIYAKSGKERTTITNVLGQTSGSSAGYALLIPGVWNNTASNITSLTVMSTTSNAFGAGSHIELWAKRGQSSVAGGWMEDTGNNYIYTNNLSRNIGVGTSTPNSKLQVAGPIATAISGKTSAYTITASDSVITANASSGAFAVTLPTAVGITGRQYTIKKTDSSANAVTVSTTSSQTIDGSTTASLSTQYQYITVVSDGSNWSVIGSNSSSGGSGLGVGQTWQNLTGSRAYGTNYTNSTGKPIQVSVTGGVTGYCGLTGTVDSITVALQWSGAAGYTQYANVVFIVPNGSTYSVTNSSGTCSLGNWAELR